MILHVLVSSSLRIENVTTSSANILRTTQQILIQILPEYLDIPQT